MPEEFLPSKGYSSSTNTARPHKAEMMNFAKEREYEVLLHGKDRVELNAPSP